jgi:hypothetical protein
MVTMRRSAHVFAPLLASAAVLLGTAGCKSHEPERCVDEQGHVADPKFCANLPPGASQPMPGSIMNGGGYYNNGFFMPHYYRYYYGGGGAFVPGGLVSGGSYAPLAGHSYSSPSATGTSRGGFGESFSGSGAHGASGGE